MRLEHGREDDAVEDDVVLADEVHHFGLFVLPVFLPVGRQVLGRRDVADRRVEPDVEHLAFGPFDRYGNAPVQVTAHRTRLQTAVEPALALPIDVGFPLFVPFEDPFAQETLVLVQRQIPVLGGAFHGYGTRYGAVRVDQFVRRKGRSAFFALVAVGAVVAAAGAGAHDIAVGEERLGFLVVVLLRGPLDEFAFVVELAEELRRCRGVGLRRGARVDVERHAEPFERRFNQLVIAIDDLLGRDALFAGLDGDGHAVLVAAADRDHVVSFQAQVARVDVRRDIDARQVADVYRAVGVGQCRGDEITLEGFTHIG